jgi:hypothetical protein
MCSIFTLLSKELNICKNIPNEIHIKPSRCTKSSPMEPYFKLVVIDDDEVAKVKDVRCSSSKHVHKQYELIGQRGPVMHPAAAPGIK